ncbi:MAG: hypothetical protein ACE5GW_03470, partial [Planctomycetota bacterium]
MVDMREGDLLYRVTVEASSWLERGRSLKIRQEGDLLGILERYPRRELKVEVIREGQVFEGILLPES